MNDITIILADTIKLLMYIIATLVLLGIAIKIIAYGIKGIFGGFKGLAKAITFKEVKKI